MLAVGAALCEGLLRSHAAGERSPTGPVAVWAIDRDANCVYGLDEDLILACRSVLSWPIEVEACRDGGAWILRAADGTPAGAGRLDRITADGTVAAEYSVGTCHSLAAFRLRSALVVEEGCGANGADRLLCFGEEEDPREIFEGAGLSCVVASGAWLALGTSAGEVLRLDPSAGASVLDRIQFGERILELAPGPESGGLWVLTAEGGSRAHLLGPDLAVRWTVDVGLTATHLAPVEAAERVWIADDLRPSVRCFGPGGALEIERTDLPLAGLGRAVSSSDGAVLICAPGAIFHLDRTGRIRPGQGGFDYLVDLDRVPGPSR